MHSQPHRLLGNSYASAGTWKMIVGLGGTPVNWPASVSWGLLSFVATSCREKPLAEKS